VSLAAANRWDERSRRKAHGTAVEGSLCLRVRSRCEQQGLREGRPTDASRPSAAAPGADRSTRSRWSSPRNRKWLRGDRLQTTGRAPRWSTGRSPLAPSVRLGASFSTSPSARYRWMVKRSQPCRSRTTQGWYHSRAAKDEWQWNGVLADHKCPGWEEQRYSSDELTVGSSLRTIVLSFVLRSTRSSQIAASPTRPSGARWSPRPLARGQVRGSCVSRPQRGQDNDLALPRIPPICRRIPRHSKSFDTAHAVLSLTLN